MSVFAYVDGPTHRSIRRRSHRTESWWMPDWTARGCAPHHSSSEKIFTLAPTGYMARCIRADGQASSFVIASFIPEEVRTLTRLRRASMISRGTISILRIGFDALPDKSAGRAEVAPRNYGIGVEVADGGEGHQLLVGRKRDCRRSARKFAQGNSRRRRRHPTNAVANPASMASV